MPGGPGVILFSFGFSKRVKLVLSAFLIKKAPEEPPQQPSQNSGVESDFFDTILQQLLEQPSVASNEAESSECEREEKMSKSAAAKISKLEAKVKELEQKVDQLQSQQQYWGDVYTKLGLKLVALEAKLK